MAEAQAGVVSVSNARDTGSPARSTRSGPISTPACTSYAARLAEWRERGGESFGPPPWPGTPRCGDPACPVHGVVAKATEKLLAEYGPQGARLALLATMNQIGYEEERKQRIRNARHALRYRTEARRG